MRRVGDLAASLGVSDRHLRRVTEAELGVSPIELAQTQKLLLAKRLLERDLAQADRHRVCVADSAACGDSMRCSNRAMA